MQNPPETVQSLLEAADAQVAAGNPKQALIVAQRALELDPKNATALNGAAILALSLGLLKEAEHFARRATQEKPLAIFVQTLANVLRTKGDLEEAAKYYNMILKHVPDDFQSLYGLGQIFEQTGHRTLALDHYERALMIQPHNSDLFHRFSKIITFTEAPRVYAALERAKPKDTDAAGLRLHFMINQARWKEYATRASQNLGSHARSPSDLFFTFGREIRDQFEALLDSVVDLENPGSWSEWKAMSQLSRGARIESQHFFNIRAQQKPNSLFECLNFTDEFYRDLEKTTDKDLAAGLPEVTDIVMADFEDRPIIFLSCDFNYFRKFAQLLLLSIDRVAQRPQVHMHIMDTPPAAFNELKNFAAKLTRTRIAMTTEDTGMILRGIDAARCYYHAIRFIRMDQASQRYNKPIWQMDVDGLMHNDLKPMFDLLDTADIALWGSPGRWEPWAQFNASLTGIKPTTVGKTYLRLVAAYISHFHKLDLLRWGIDQLAMFGVHEYLKDQNRGLVVAMIPSHAIDGEFLEHGLIWSNGGIGKFSAPKLAAAVTNTPPDTPRIRYLEELKLYTGGP